MALLTSSPQGHRFFTLDLTQTSRKRFHHRENHKKTSCRCNQKAGFQHLRIRENRVPEINSNLININFASP